MNTHTRFHGGESIEAEYWHLSKINKNGVIVKKTQLPAYTRPQLIIVSDTACIGDQLTCFGPDHLDNAGY